METAVVVLDGRGGSEDTECEEAVGGGLVGVGEECGDEEEEVAG